MSDDKAHLPTASAGSSEWQETLVEDRYAELDRLAEGFPPTSGRPALPAATDPDAAPRVEEASPEQNLLDEIQALAQEVRWGAAVPGGEEWEADEPVGGAEEPFSVSEDEPSSGTTDGSELPQAVDGFDAPSASACRSLPVWDVIEPDWSADSAPVLTFQSSQDDDAEDDPSGLQPAESSIEEMIEETEPAGPAPIDSPTWIDSQISQDASEAAAVSWDEATCSCDEETWIGGVDVEQQPVGAVEEEPTAEEAIGVAAVHVNEEPVEGADAHETASAEDAVDGAAGFEPQAEIIAWIAGQEIEESAQEIEEPAPEIAPARPEEIAIDRLAETPIDPTVQQIRIDAVGPRRYSQLFSRLRRLRSQAGGNRSLAEMPE